MASCGHFTISEVAFTLGYQDFSEFHYERRSSACREGERVSNKHIELSGELSSPF